MKTLIAVIPAALVFLGTAGAQAQTAKPVHPQSLPRMVAYDAKDKKYYSVAYAKAHGMRDRGGDLLTIVPSKSLPKEAKMSRAMHGKM